MTTPPPHPGPLLHLFISLSRRALAPLAWLRAARAAQSRRPGLRPGRAEGGRWRRCSATPPPAGWGRRRRGLLSLSSLGREWNGRLPPLMLSLGRVEVDPRGPTASKCQGKIRCLPRQTGGSAMQLSKTVVGVDTAQTCVSTLLGRDGDGRDQGTEARAGEVPGALRQPRALRGGDGGVRGCAALGAAPAGAGPRSPPAAGAEGAPLRGRQQERRSGRVCDLDGGAAAGHQDGCDQERGAAGDSWHCTACASSW